MLDEELDEAVATNVRLTIGVSLTGSYIHKLRGEDGAIKDYNSQLQSNIQHKLAISFFQLCIVFPSPP